MSEKRKRRYRRRMKEILKDDKAMIRQALRHNAGTSWWDGFGVDALLRRVKAMDLAMNVRFLTGRCVACGRWFRKKRWSHDACSEVCMHAALDRIMNIRGYAFPPTE